jgi:hypothetical protein
MTVRIHEHDGIYTAYKIITKRGDNGHLYESVKRVDIAFPPIDETNWSTWSVCLTEDELEVGVQIFYDKWNFGNGLDIEGRIFQHLSTEREWRKFQKIPLPDFVKKITTSNKPTKGNLHADVITKETKRRDGHR